MVTDAGGFTTVPPVHAGQVPDPPEKLLHG
jgi:hypothetical protein